MQTCTRLEEPAKKSGDTLSCIPKNWCPSRCALLDVTWRLASLHSPLCIQIRCPAGHKYKCDAPPAVGSLTISVTYQTRCAVSVILLHRCQTYQTRCSVSVTLLHRHHNAHFAVFCHVISLRSAHRYLQNKSYPKRSPS